MKHLLILKKIIIAVWLLFLIFCVGSILMYPELFTPRGIADFLAQFKNSILFVYFLCSILRGFTLIPSTPLVLAGTIIFPTESFWVLAISLTGIAFSSTLIYFFSAHLGFQEYFERRHSKKIGQIQRRLQKNSGFIFVFLWSFFPLLPTDLVCYVAGILKMDFKRFILAITFGELIICSIYIFFYSYLHYSPILPW